MPWAPPFQKKKKKKTLNLAFLICKPFHKNWYRKMFENNRSHVNNGGHHRILKFSWQFGDVNQ